MSEVSTVHIFRAPSQPATRFVDRNVPKPHWFRYNPRALFFTNCCRKRRWAKHVRVQVYYDNTYGFCADGHGCRA